jgi:hypothetical protein
MSPPAGSRRIETATPLASIGNNDILGIDVANRGHAR